MNKIAIAPANVNFSNDPQVRRARSQDYNWFSPVLKEQLGAKLADVVASPTSESEIAEVVRWAVREKMPLTLRGGGSGNYGQCVPLLGGCVVDMTGFNKVTARSGSSVTAQTGIRIDVLQDYLHESQQELRLYPSSQRMSSLGGFIGGGAGGVGSVTWGFLWDDGNVLSARVMTIEEEPRILELRGAELAVVLHAYGTTGIILELEMPLAPYYPWVETMWAFPHFSDAVAFSKTLASSNAIIKRDVATIQQGIPVVFRPLAPWLKADDNIVLASTSATSNAQLDALAVDFGVERRFHFTESDLAERKLRPNYEYGWNHATLNFLKSDRSVTYLQCGYPLGEEQRCVAELEKAFGDELRVQMQWIRDGADIVSAGLNIIRYTTPKRLQEIAAIHRSMGIDVNNCHSFQVESGVEPGQHHHAMARFKKSVDPLHLLNPGKLAAAGAKEPFDAALIPEGFRL